VFICDYLSIYVLYSGLVDFCLESDILVILDSMVYWSFGKQA